VREINLGFDLIAFSTAGTGGTARGLRFTGGVEMGTHLFRFVLLERTGMRFLLGYPDFRKHIEDRLALDFQFSSQIVDSNLAHPSLVSSGFSR
jgi:hypothetical protein